MHPPINTTFIAIIPKNGHPNFIEEFRPISLCNITYKVIVKIIPQGLKNVLEKTIYVEQSGLLEGRQIHEAIGVAHEGLHSIKSKKLKGAVIKINLSKYFNKGSWIYLRILLTHLEFHYSIIKHIFSYISTTTFSFLINGSASSFFHSKRGLR